MAAVATKNQGIEFYIGTKAASASGDTFVQVKRVDTIGEFGPETDIKDVTCLEDLAKVKIKGIPDFGEIEIEGNRVFSDAGQTALLAAGEDTDDDAYNCRIRMPGAGATNTNLQFDFKALIGKMKTAAGQVDGVIRFSSSAAVSGAIVQSTYTTP